MSANSDIYDIVVLGAGPTGLAAALALATLGLEVALAAPAPDASRPDPRTTALLGPSVDFLVNLGVWPAIAAVAEPITGIRIIDDRGGLIRAPEVLFAAGELDLAAFGYNVANAPLVSALWGAVHRAAGLAVLPSGAVARIEHGDKGVALHFESGAVARCRLLIGADGRASPARAAAGIDARTWSYPQAAVVTTFSHTRDHHGISTEFHRASGPVTTVPLCAQANYYRSSLVWVSSPDEAARLMQVSAEAFAADLETRFQGFLGPVSALTPRAVLALSGLSAKTVARRRTVLVGEAAHVLPPIGAQGLNLGLRDAAALADCVAASRDAGEPVGCDAMLARYAAARHADIAARTTAIDLLNRSLLTDLIPVQAVRGLGLHALANIGPLRRAAMRQGLEPVGDRPRLMRPGGGISRP